jgi:hypothetical protein
MARSATAGPPASALTRQKLRFRPDRFRGRGTAGSKAAEKTTSQMTYARHMAVAVL